MSVDHLRKPTVVIVGAGYAGMTAAHRLGGKAHVTVVTPVDRFVDRIRLHQYAAGTLTEEEVAPPLPELLPRSATLVLGTVRAVRSGLVILDDGRELTGDHVVVAAGSGVGAGITNLESTRRVRTGLAQLSAGASVRIDGAGHTGVELAAELVERRPDLQVLIVDPAGLLPRVSSHARAKIERHFDRAGITVVTEPPRESAPDLVVDCTGFALPRIEGVGAPDETLSFGPGLWVAGDIAQTGHRWSCAAAEPMGAHVADNIVRVTAGLEPRPLRFGFAIQCLSLGRRRGVVQTVRPDDVPRRLIISGAPGAMVKERVSRMARRVATGSAPRYRWPSGPSLNEIRAKAPEQV